jgi:peptide alpha-N-acetyltransferase
MSAYEETLKNPPSKTDFENSEAVLYKNSLIAEQGDYERAFEHLKTFEKYNLDRLAVLELRAEYLTKLGKKEEAAKAYRNLLDRNSEHKVYYDALVEALDIDAADHKARKAIYDEYAEKYPRCDAARRLPLDFLEDDGFREAADQYLHRMLDKGVPSTFANLKHLYANATKKEILLALAQQYIDSGKSEENSEPKRNGDTSKGASAAYYFLAQHYNYYLSRDLDKAMEYIEKAIELEPESVDFHMTKARIWKHYGNTQKASEIMEQARKLDTRDRHINTKAAKYQLRNNETEAAIKTVGLFTRAETIGGPLADLHDMQCMWFLNEDGQSYLRQGKFGLALKRFTTIFNIFDVWQEDQFDFHNFSLRKGQMRAYVDMMRWEDQLRSHPFFSRAALAAIKVYLKLHDKPLTNGANGTNGESAEDAAERKRAAKKARKEAQKAEREALVKKNEPNKPIQDQNGDIKKKDDDPDGVKLEATTTPLEDAMKFLNPLLLYSPKSIDAQIAGFEVFIRRKKYALALKCLLAASALNPSHSKVHEQTIRLRLALDTALPTLAPPISSALKSEFTPLLPFSTDPAKFNDEYKSQHTDCARRTLSALKMRKLLRPEEAGEVEKEVLEIIKLEGIMFEEAVEVLEVLREWGSGVVESFRERAEAKWGKATVFEKGSTTTAAAAAV